MVDDSAGGPKSVGARHQQPLSNASLFGSFMENVDRTAARIPIAAFTGLSFGASIATFRGSPIPHTALTTSVSCAIAATACLGTERIFNAILPLSSPGSFLDGNDDFLSHSLAGIFGGGYLGWVHQGKPIAGAVLFVPLMLGVAFTERKVDQYRIERLRQILEEHDKNGKR
mmetsp:Transcript_6116/g.8830  ORF Transcript_6116/g.8830 Transcript_6116/m.8830 type:complete len:171 (-) Transcript_6116:127-639(-)